MDYDIRVDDYGNKMWYLNGKLHREDGPAVEWVTGGKQWWLNGKLHREDGPAVERANGDKDWWFNGRYLTREAWLEIIPEDLKVRALFNGVLIKG